MIKRLGLLLMIIVILIGVSSAVTITKTQSNHNGVYEKYTISNNGYKYLFYHVVNSRTGENVFRIYKLQKGTTDLTKSGNWEKAFKLNDSSLVGGMHGNEKVTSINFYLDGKRINPWINRHYTGNKLVVLENTNFYNPNNKNQIICKANTTYTWQGHNLNLDTKYNWKVNATVQTFFSGMFPTNNLIFKYGQIEGYSTQKLVNTGVQYNNDKNISSKGTVWNEARNFYMFMKTSRTGPAWIRCCSAYNKIYLTWVYNGALKVRNGEIWNTNTIYRMG
jgi:hypothetical protein